MSTKIQRIPLLTLSFEVEYEECKYIKKKVGLFSSFLLQHSGSTFSITIYISNLVVIAIVY